MRHHKGFTLIELMAVIVILSILATAAVVAYRFARIQQYDSEAIADINDIYAQAFRVIGDYGVRTPGGPRDLAGAITAGCYSVNQDPNPATIGITFPTSRHWIYELCIGKSNDDATDSPDAFFVLAHRAHTAAFAGLNDRCILLSSAISSPVVDMGTSLPDVAQLQGVNLALINNCLDPITIRPAP